MTFAFAWLFKRTGSATQVFESLSILIIILCLINIPFIFYDLSTGVSVKGDPLAMKGVFVQPQGLSCTKTKSHGSMPLAPSWPQRVTSCGSGRLTLCSARCLSCSFVSLFRSRKSWDALSAY